LATRDSAILASAGDDGTVALWEPPSGQTGRAHGPLRIWDLGDQATALAWSSQTRLVGADRSGTITTFEV
jgi:hypothetical protein